MLVEQKRLSNGSSIRILFMNMLRNILFIGSLIVTMTLSASGPMATDYSFNECEGSAMPYPYTGAPAEYPDSLVPVFINHVGRHGARYPSSASNCLNLKRALEHADSIGSITTLGRKLKSLNDRIISLSNNRWGALDTLGMSEQAGIALRMFYGYTEVFSSGGTVRALSSYSPRAMMSMYCFVHQLDRLNNRMTFQTVTGRVNSPALRPFDLDKDFINYRRSGPWKKPYDEYVASTVPLTALRRVLGENYRFGSEEDARAMAMVEYAVVSGVSAMGLESEMATYFTPEEANALWSCKNLSQYLQRTATTVSTLPADIAATLVTDIINTTDAYVKGTDRETTAILRFGHAETLMPLLSLLRIPGCYYLTNYFDTVATHWRNFDVVPMAANVQFILFKSRKSGNFYVRINLNEVPVRLRKGSDDIYFPWPELRRYMNECLPL